MTDRPRQRGSSRRSFLKQTLAAGALALGADAAPTRFTTAWAGGFMRSEAANERQDELDRLGKLDCAIIGSGISGLYTGWRLLQDKRYRNIAVFEMSNRTGGRLLTWLPHGKGSGLRAELGGMRFYEDQQLVWNLIKYLGLHVTRFYVAGPNLLWYLRGQRMKSEDADTAARRYALAQGERGKSPADLVEDVTNRVLSTPENQAVLQEYLKGRQPEDQQDWDRIKPHLTYQGQSLWNIGFWNVLNDVLSYEAYQYISDAAGYYNRTSNWNAAEAMQHSALGHSQAQTLIEGYSQLPETLRDSFQEQGGHVLLNQQLLRFEAAADGTFLLFFRGSSADDLVARAERLVLAMPRRALELLEPSKTFNLQQNPELKQLLNSVVEVLAFKLFLLYEKRWWETGAGIVHGRSVCDLPIRQTYYFRPDACERGTSQACPGYGLLMASYDDARAVEYWKGMEVPPEEKEKGRQELRQILKTMPTVFSGLRGAAPDEYADPPPNLHKAPKAMLQRAKHQLALLHGMNVKDIPEPLVGAYADWSLDPFGGGWSHWQPQVNVEGAMRHVKKPLGDQYKVYIVGEAYSGQQGWVEGALTTAELVLQKEFGLQRPSWLPANYYLGW